MRKCLGGGASGNGMHELLGGPVVVDPVRTQVLVRQRECQLVERRDHAGALVTEIGSPGLGADGPGPWASSCGDLAAPRPVVDDVSERLVVPPPQVARPGRWNRDAGRDRKSTRLNSSH